MSPEPGDGHRAGTLQAVGFWLASRVALGAFTVAVCWLMRVDSGGRLTGPTRWFLERFTWWDSFHFLCIVERGYLPLESGCCDQAFFPGYPLAIRAVLPLAGGNAALAGLMVSLLAGAAAAGVLWHLGRLVTGTVAGGGLAVLTLVLAPYGFFLITVYSEALFLACALGAWAAGLTRRWWVAGVLAALASLVRINGLFLAAALLVLYLQQAHRDAASADLATAGSSGERSEAMADLATAGPSAELSEATADLATAGPSAERSEATVAGRPRGRARGVVGLAQGWARLRRGARWDVLALALPVLPVAGFFALLRARTGSWNAWQETQELGWHRRPAWPWQGIAEGWHSLRTANTPDLAISRWADLLVTLFGVVLVVVLVALRRWAEAAFVLPNVAVLVCSTTLISAPRYGLVWFPAYLLLAELSLRPRWRWLPTALAVVCLPMLAVVAVSFAAHGWTA